MVPAIPERTSGLRKSCKFNGSQSIQLETKQRRVHAVILVIAAAFLWVAPSVFASDPPRFRIPRIAQYVPADAGLFVFSDRILATELDTDDDGILQLMLKLSGGNPVGWKAMLTEALGLDSNAALRELLKERLAIAAPDWNHLEDGVIIIDEYNKRLLPLVTGKGRVKKQEKDNDVNIFQTPSGLWVAATRRILILSQRSDDKSVFRRSAKLLAGGNDAPLASNAQFRTCVSGLPPGCKACLYWHDQALEATAAKSAGTVVSPLWASSSSNAVGLQGQQNVLEVTHVGPLNSNGATDYRPRVKFQQVRQLPQTTLASWSTSIKWRDFLSDPKMDPKIVDVLKMIGVFGEGGQSDIHEDIVANLGPRCTVIIGADFADKYLRPRAAIMVESVDSQAIVAAINKYVGNSNESKQPTETTNGDSAEPDPPKVHTIALPARPPAPKGDTIGALIAEELAPSYAAIDGWFVVSTSPDHAQEIIEASLGKSPRLEDVLPIHAHTQRVGRATDLVIVQPSFLHGILQFWESQLQTRTTPKPYGSRWGIEFQTELLPGQVVVVNVDSNGVAANRLLSGDRILACNAILLDFENPNQHLKNLMAPVEAPMTLRVLRSDSVLDILIPQPPNDTSPATSRINTLLTGAEPFQSMFLNSTIALYIKDRPAKGIAVTRLAIELDREGLRSKAQEADRNESR